MLNNLQQMYFKLVQKIKKTGEAAGDLIGSNHRIVQKYEHDKKIPKQRYISPVERQKIIDDLRLMIV